MLDGLGGLPTSDTTGSCAPGSGGGNVRHTTGPNVRGEHLMREYSTPPSMEPPTTGNLTDDVVAQRPRGARPGRVLHPAGDAGPASGPASPPPQFLEDVRAVAKGLIAAGIEPGDRVALVSRTRYEWTLLDYATWFAGAVTVPVYETSSAEQIGWILAGLRRARRRRRGPRARRPGHRGAARADRPQPRLVLRRQRRGDPRPARRRRLRRGAREAAYDGWPRATSRR